MPLFAARSRLISDSAVNDVDRGPDTLAPFAAHDAHSRGRRFPEPAPEYRSEFQRDRDRIIHSNAFQATGLQDARSS